MPPALTSNMLFKILENKFKVKYKINTPSVLKSLSQNWRSIKLTR